MGLRGNGPGARRRAISGPIGNAMLQGWVVIAVALGYIGLLFLVASYGDRVRRLGREGRARVLIGIAALAYTFRRWRRTGPALAQDVSRP